MIQKADLKNVDPPSKINGLDLFSGTGGFTLALDPWVRSVAYCESDAHAQAVLLSRMAEHLLPLAPIWDDIATLGRSHFAGVPVDIIVGGFPCTDLSSASHGRGAGLQGSESGLWYEMLRLISELRPGNVFIENVAGAARDKWLPFVRRDLWELGYASLPLELHAEDVGAPFRGARVFVAATDMHSESARPLNAQAPLVQKFAGPDRTDWGHPPPAALGVADGVPRGLDRLRRMGNAVVPTQARVAFEILFDLKPSTPRA